MVVCWTELRHPFSGCLYHSFSTKGIKPDEVSNKSATNISYTVVYEQSKWFKNDKRILFLGYFDSRGHFLPIKIQ
ncbi:hypothetical protein SAMN05661091_3057 [Paenibacillus uliginis N3/975]|uniref:Uncharacterized protein n=1 Tax=Paenibacillus uliginis N3/975 TaxID=1313296 RepID=A0A1X7HF91_9BACL|nr:hypothetical protein [Paenibacillus uliginis]SMF85570.1 hypothetical protein SAMN05661091_3057 [Paenibacillus uliginis N3/975]